MGAPYSLQFVRSFFFLYSLQRVSSSFASPTLLKSVSYSAAAEAVAVAAVWLLDPVLSTFRLTIYKCCMRRCALCVPLSCQSGDRCKGGQRRERQTNKVKVRTV